MPKQPQQPPPTPAKPTKISVEITLEHLPEGVQITVDGVSKIVPAEPGFSARGLAWLSYIGMFTLVEPALTERFSGHERPKAKTATPAPDPVGETMDEVLARQRKGAKSKMNLDKMRSTRRTDGNE